jgi:hypothetical protein
MAQGNCGKPTTEQNRTMATQIITVLNACLQNANGSTSKVNNIKAEVRLYCQQDGIPARPTDYSYKGNITEELLGRGDDSLLLRRDPNDNRLKPITDPLPTDFGSLGPVEAPPGSTVPVLPSPTEILVGTLAGRLESALGKHADKVNNQRKELCPKGSNVALQVVITCGKAGGGYTAPVIWSPKGLG